MPCLLIVEKTGSIKELNVKSYSEDELYKKAGFKSNDGFELKTSWDIQLPNSSDPSKTKKYFICVYGKTKGRAGQENKYDFPPPIDTTLFFGSCILVNHPEGEDVESLTKAEWTKIYEYLFGGFEDLGSEDSEESEDDSEDEAIPKTKSGYAKDGFVVEDKDESDESEESSDESVEEVIPKKTSKKLPKWATKSQTSKKPTKKSTEKINKKKTVFDSIETDTQTVSNEENIVLECSDELKEEEYL
jgi:hypothetical protein